MVRDNDAVNRSGRSNAKAVDDVVDRIAQKFEARYERNIQLPRGEFLAKRAGMIEVDVASPAVDKRQRVKIPYAADPQRSRGIQAIASSGSRAAAAAGRGASALR